MNNKIEETLPIVKYGNPILRKKVNDITNFNCLNTLIDKMFNTMYKEQGIGLAANQVGYDLNLLIVDTSTIEDSDRIEENKYIFINSKVIDTKDSCKMEEGCLSVPDIRAEIERPEIITIEYQDINQKIYRKTFSGIVSRVIQHELDHLNGKFFIDYLSPAKRRIIHKKLIEISKTGKPSTGVIL